VAPVVVLVGAPGAGKSTVGPALAAALRVGFCDTDAEVEVAAGRSIFDVFVESGEAAFRELERVAVQDALAGCDGVVSLGGGAVLDAGTRGSLAGCPVVWLRVGLATAAARVGLNTARPLLLGNVRGQLSKLLEDRAALYAQVARATVDTDQLDPDAVVAAVLVALGLDRPA